MIRILANDGIDLEGQQILEAAGYHVETKTIAQDDLMTQLQAFEVLIVRSATKVRKPLIDACPNLKIIARGGVGMDNIDVEYARSKGIEVINTPAASSQAVAELVFSHMFSLSRFLHTSNRHMPSEGVSKFKNLKSDFAEGVQLQGKTLGIVGFGRIGQSVARMGLGLGMKIVAVDPFIASATIALNTTPEHPVSVTIKTGSMDTLLAESDYITLHVPGGDTVIGTAEIAKLKDGVVLINTARGGAIDEDALLLALQEGKVKGAGLDVFTNEPTPRADLLAHPAISSTPHIGAATVEAQANIGLELAEKIMAVFSK